MSGFSRATATALLAWALSRCAVMLWWAFTPFGGAAATDLYRYALFATEGGVASDLFPWEYPAMARLLLGSGSGLDLTGYASIFLLAMVACDFAFTIWLLRPAQRERSSAGVWWWILTVPLLGVIPYTRYDMVVSCAVAIAIAWSGRRPRIAAVLLSLAIALKLWPLILLPLLMLRARPGERRGVLLAACVPWIAFELVGALLWGARSVTAPWLWQQERGLQIESIAAGPLRILHSSANPVEFRFNAWETASPPWVLASLALIGLLLVALVVVESGRRLMSPHLTEHRADAIFATTSVLVIGLLIVSGKVLSPQYLLWLIAPIAAVSAHRTRQDRWLLALVATTCMITTLVYPILYSQLIAGEALPWAVLQLRNLLLVIAVGVLALRWRESLTAQPRQTTRSEPNLEVIT